MLCWVLAPVYSAESNYVDAVRNYETALGLNERSPEAHWGLTIAYACLGRQMQARDHLDRFKKLAPDSRHIIELEDWVARVSGQLGAPTNRRPPHR
jgi:tetratricopeptide (TPR) repeat protein